MVLLEAIALLPDVRGELAGGHLPTEETYADTLEARAAQPDLAGRVRLLGHVDAMEAMRGWDVAVLASLRPEAGPLAALEAMSIGLPVVATDHGGSAEYLADGRGVLVPPGDALALAEGIRTALDAARRPSCPPSPTVGGGRARPIPDVAGPVPRRDAWRGLTAGSVHGPAHRHGQRRDRGRRRRSRQHQGAPATPSRIAVACERIGCFARRSSESSRPRATWYGEPWRKSHQRRLRSCQ